MRVPGSPIIRSALRAKSGKLNETTSVIMATALDRATVGPSLNPSKANRRSDMPTTLCYEALMITLRQAQADSNLKRFIAEHEADPAGDAELFEATLRSMAGMSKEAPEASPPDDSGD